MQKNQPVVFTTLLALTCLLGFGGSVMAQKASGITQHRLDQNSSDVRIDQRNAKPRTPVVENPCALPSRALRRFKGNCADHKENTTDAKIGKKG